MMLCGCNSHRNIGERERDRHSKRQRERDRSDRKSERDIGNDRKREREREGERQRDREGVTILIKNQSKPTPTFRVDRIRNSFPPLLTIEFNRSRLPVGENVGLWNSRTKIGEKLLKKRNKWERNRRLEVTPRKKNINRKKNES